MLDQLETQAFQRGLRLRLKVERPFGLWTLRVVVARPSDGAVPSGPLLVVDVPYTNRKASSVSGNKKMGEGYGRGMLTDSEGWRASANGSLGNIMAQGMSVGLPHNS